MQYIWILLAYSIYLPRSLLTIVRLCQNLTVDLSTKYRHTFLPKVILRAADMTNYRQMEGHISCPDIILMRHETRTQS